jgi:RNA polymerase sigma-70 factor (ECF subfamily)
MAGESGSDDEGAELARRAAERDAAAWSYLFEAEFQNVYRFVRYRLRGASEAEDIASQVFEVAYLNAHRFDYRGVPIQAWLFGIARNLVRDHVKKLRRRGFHDEITETMMPPELDRTDDVDMQHDLSAAMEGLTEDQQTVLSLRFLLDKSVAETAILMDRSEDAVKNLQRRALAAMHRALAEVGYEGASG